MNNNGAYHIAELNFGVLRQNWDDPRVAEFVDNLDRVNALAERSDGFVWRMTDEDMDGAQNDPDGVFGGNPRVASTLSVWRSAQALHSFAYKTLHHQFLKKGPEWFEPHQGPRYVLWKVAGGHIPTLTEAKQRFDHLVTHGPTAAAFDFNTCSEFCSEAEAA